MLWCWNRAHATPTSIDICMYVSHCNRRIFSGADCVFQVMDALRMSNLDVEALELFSEAGTSYQKPKAVFLKLELDLKQARLLAGLHGQSKRKVAPAANCSLSIRFMVFVCPKLTCSCVGMSEGPRLGNRHRGISQKVAAARRSSCGYYGGCRNLWYCSRRSDARPLSQSTPM